jgi:ankyrin repeat protein
MIDKQKRDYAHRLFQCLVVSRRPLRVEELAELFAIQPNVGTIPTFNAGWRPEDPEEFVLSACSTLVAVVNDSGEQIVQFSHFSVREYLISDRIATSEHVSCFRVLPRLAHALLARACLSVLLQLDDRVDRNDVRTFPLALYATQFWVDHAQFENVSSDIRDGMEYLFDRNKPHFAAWLRLYNIDYPLDILMTTGRAARPYPVPLYYAALCGFRDIAEHIVDVHPQDINARGGKRVTPLHAAVHKGHLSVVMLLVERGADLESRDSRSRTPLHVASYLGYAEVASLLINCGADLHAEDFNQETPLYLASAERRHRVARLLLEHDADANYPDVGGRTPLYVASREGYDDIVQLLLEHGAGANLQGNDGFTPLRLASRKGHDHVVQLLLDHGADANRSDSDGWTPLRFALQDGYERIVKLLLDHGADANHLDKQGWTPLHLASWEGRDDMVQLLLNHGAAANHPDSDGWTPLHLASHKGHNHIVRLLLNYIGNADAVEGNRNVAAS